MGKATGEVKAGYNQGNLAVFGASRPQKQLNYPLSQGPCNDAYTAESVMTKVKALKET